MVKFDDQDSSRFKYRGNSIERTSTEFLERLRSRESEAWNTFLRIYVPLIRFWCLQSGFGLAWPERQDISQEVCAKVSAGIHKFDHNRKESSFRGWLRTITNNQIRDYFRARKKNENVTVLIGDNDYAVCPVAFLGEDENDDPECEAKELIVLTRQVMKQVKMQVKEKSWEVFRLQLVEGKDSSEIAEMMGMTGDAVRQIRSRILKRIREEFAKLGIDPDSTPPIDPK